MADCTDQLVITRTMLQDAIRALGLDPKEVSEVTMEPHIVTVTRIHPVVADHIYGIEG